MLQIIFIALHFWKACNSLPLILFTRIIFEGYPIQGSPMHIFNHIDFVIQGQTALHLAAIHGHDMIIKMLINDYGNISFQY